MPATIASMNLLIAINLVFAVVALAVGFVAGAWFGVNRKGKSGPSAEELAEQEHQKQLERERAALATGRLRDLASGMASDVGEHSARVGQITDELRLLDTNDVEATGAGLVDALAKIVAANETLQDRLDKAEEQIAAQAREIHLHESEARTDSLTGLANRRAFDDEMKRRYSEASRKDTPLSLLIMDIDHFKNFNDTHGHQAGDAVLQAVADKLAESCREMDVPCRYGGEEFAVVMPATTRSEASSAAERIRTAVESMTVIFDGKRLQVTTSIGVAQLTGHEDVPRLLRRADDALYESKDAGRNCAHSHDGVKCIPSTPRIIQEREAAAKASVVKANTKALDSLPNRTKFADELRRRMAETTRTEQPLAVLVIELANHEQIKKRMGTAVGCVALDAVAKILAQSLREMDLLARLSETSFVCMLPDVDSDTAREVGVRATTLLRDCPLALGDEEIYLELKVGAAQESTADTVEEFVSRAVGDLTSVEPDLVGS